MTPTDSLHMPPTRTAIVTTDAPSATVPTVLTRLADIPEEDIWLAKQKSARTRRADIGIVTFQRVGQPPAFYSAE